MKIFGYPEDSDSDTPTRMDEVTLQASAAELRKIAAFIERAAGVMEESGVDFGHEHLRDYDRDTFGRPDLIIVRPGA